ncbi:hypothetical protein D9M68_863590 [compost metagenome]
MYQVVWRFTDYADQFTSFFQHYIGRTGDQAITDTSRNTAQRTHTAGHDNQCIISSTARGKWRIEVMRLPDLKGKFFIRFINQLFFPHRICILTVYKVYLYGEILIDQSFQAFQEKFRVDRSAGTGNGNCNFHDE